MHFNNSKVCLKLTFQSGYPIIQILIRHLHCMEDVLCLQTGSDRANDILIQNISGFQIPYKFQSFLFFSFFLFR